MKKKHTKSFKLNAVKKVIGRQSNETIEDYAISLGVGYSTLTRWMRQVQCGELTPEQQTLTEKRPSDWTTAEKLQAIIDSEAIPEQERGRYCREQGLFEHHLKQWKQEIMAKDEEKEQRIKAENRALKEELKQVKRELLRKEKALAEVAALLVLKKKAQELFGSGEEA